ncbi:aminotransferase class IV [Streptosporangium subroseum]|uniref:aminotransferase class IV n=1 Tax=Streptosporangium subroseum TaxID=106412 RepID=UPI00341D8B34
MDRLVAVYGSGLVDPDTPIVCADDQGLLRGDGVFEAWLLREGAPVLLDAHLDRLYRSVARLALDLPERTGLVRLIREAAEAWPRDIEAVQRLVVTRGRSAVGRPTVYTMVERVPHWTATNRRNGIRLVTGTVGFPIHERRDAPWLLGGVKSLSYAVNMASQRWGAIRGAQEMLWVSSDGYALETPSFSLVWLTESTLCTVPGWTGIIVGTTAAALSAQAPTLGLTAVEMLVTPGELASAEAVWVTGSLSGVLAVTELDGQPLAQSALLDPARNLIGYSGG